MLPATPPGPTVPLAPNAAAAAVTRPPLASVDAPGMLKRFATDTPHSPPESLPAPHDDLSVLQCDATDAQYY